MKKLNFALFTLVLVLPGNLKSQQLETYIERDWKTNKARIIQLQKLGGETNNVYPHYNPPRVEQGSPFRSEIDRFLNRDSDSILRQDNPARVE